MVKAKEIKQIELKKKIKAVFEVDRVSAEISDESTLMYDRSRSKKPSQ